MEDPPITERSPVTARPVLLGFAPGVTVTVSNTLDPGATAEALALATSVGLLVPPWVVATVIATSSMRVFSVPATAFDVPP